MYKKMLKAYVKLTLARASTWQSCSLARKGKGRDSRDDKGYPHNDVDAQIERVQGAETLAPNRFWPTSEVVYVISIRALQHS
jgi:hypothetical protein